MRAALILLLVASCVSSPTAVTEQPTPVPESPDAAAIRATALDYIEGWYAGDADRMTRALHPDLAKRIVVTKDGVSTLDHMGAEKLVANTRAGYGKETPPDKVQTDVTILDVFENAASVKIVAGEWIDYLHVARFDGRWVIVNVLWELK